MAGIVHTVYMCISRLTTLVAFCNYFVCNALSKTLVKYKIFSVKFIGKAFLLYLIGIIDNTTFQVKNLLKPFVKQIGRSFFRNECRQYST